MYCWKNSCARVENFWLVKISYLLGRFYLSLHNLLLLFCYSCIKTLIDNFFWGLTDKFFNDLLYLLDKVIFTFKKNLIHFSHSNNITIFPDFPTPNFHVCLLFLNPLIFSKKVLVEFEYWPQPPTLNFPLTICDKTQRLGYFFFYNFPEVRIKKILNKHSSFLKENNFIVNLWYYR